MAHWIGAQEGSELVKNLKKCFLRDVTKREPLPEWNTFFNRN